MFRKKNKNSYLQVGGASSKFASTSQRHTYRVGEVVKMDKTGITNTSLHYPHGVIAGPGVPLKKFTVKIAWQDVEFQGKRTHGSVLKTWNWQRRNGDALKDLAAIITKDSGVKYTGDIAELSA